HKGRAQSGADERNEEVERDHGDEQADAHHHQRRFDAQALPGDDDVARHVGKPRDTVGGGADQDQINDDADHGAAGLPSAATASAAMCRLAAMAASRVCAFLTQPAASALASSGSDAISFSAPAILPRSASILIRAITDVTSSPGGASTGVTRTSRCALASSLLRNVVSPDEVSVACCKAGTSSASSCASTSACGTPVA